MAMVPTLYGLEVAPVAPKHWCYGIDSVKERVIRNYFFPPQRAPLKKTPGQIPPACRVFGDSEDSGFGLHDGRRTDGRTKPGSPQTPFLRTGNRNGTRISISVFLRFQKDQVAKNETADGGRGLRAAAPSGPPRPHAPNCQIKAPRKMVSSLARS